MLSIILEYLLFLNITFVPISKFTIFCILQNNIITLLSRAQIKMEKRSLLDQDHTPNERQNHVSDPGQPKYKDQLFPHPLLLPFRFYSIDSFGH